MPSCLTSTFGWLTYRGSLQQRDYYPVRLLCQLVEVPASGYYAWQQAQQQVVEQAEPVWETALVKVFGVHKRCYGTRRLRVELRRKGYHVGRQHLRTALRRRGLRALQPKTFTLRTTDSTHELRHAPNRLLNQPKPTQANQVWVSAITHLPPATGDWAYFCAFQDMASQQVVGWHVLATIPEELITKALQRAFWAQPPTPGLLVHSDRGGQYCGNVYRQLLHDHEALRSQSRRGDCYDNAQAESRWLRLKTEVLEGRERPVFADLADAQASVADYFDYYNHERLHSGIGYQTPYHTHQQLLQLKTYPNRVKRVVFLGYGHDARISHFGHALGTSVTQAACSRPQSASLRLP
ncbi:MAG: IS3 family transposase [Hymenobacter sp.]|nr:MAG: IS3 family transposase [Hymenobacter sp.]